MSEWLDIAVTWIPIVLAVGANGYLILRALEARRCLSFFCGRAWIRGQRDFRIVLGLFEPDTDINERPNQRVLVVDQVNRTMLQPSGSCEVTCTTSEEHAPMRIRHADGSQGELIPTASKAWVSHTATPQSLSEEQLTAGKCGHIVISESGGLWRYAPAATYMDLQPRWQVLVPLLSPFLSWDDTNAAKAVDDVLPFRQLKTTLHSSIDFSRKADIHDDPVLYVGSPRSIPPLELLLKKRNVAIAIEEDRVAEGKVRFVAINGKRVYELAPKKEDERVAIVGRIHRGEEAGVCSFVCGCSARITKQAGEYLAANWQDLWRRARHSNKGCKSFVAVFRMNRQQDMLPNRPELFCLKDYDTVDPA